MISAQTDGNENFVPQNMNKVLASEADTVYTALDPRPGLLKVMRASGFSTPLA